MLSRSRYLNFLIYEDSNHPNIILWLHDITPLPWYQGATLSESGKHLYEMAVRNEIIRKTVVLTPFHERKIRSNYDLPKGIAIPTTWNTRILNSATSNLKQEYVYKCAFLKKN